MNRREALMKRLQMYDFVLTETGLFLDSHPKHAEALEYYEKYLKLREETLGGIYQTVRHRQPYHAAKSAGMGLGRIARGRGKKGRIKRCGRMRNGWNIR